MAAVPEAEQLTSAVTELLLEQGLRIVSRVDADPVVAASISRWRGTTERALSGPAQRL